MSAPTNKKKPLHGPKDAKVVNQAGWLKVFGRGNSQLQDQKKWLTASQVTLSAIAFFVAGFVLGNSNFGSEQTLSNSVSTDAKSAITETQLMNSVLEAKRIVYWAGPETSTKYLLDISDPQASFVTYLKSASNADSPNSKNRVVATYYRDDAFQATLEAGTLENGVSTLRENGTSVIYFNNALPTNVYVAFKGIPYQIEIFDPEPSIALAIASEIGRIRPIE